MAFDPPLGSTSPAVLLDNATRLDNLLNSLALVYPDREGADLDTWRGIMLRVSNTLDDIRQNLIPLSRQYMTLAAAQADIANIPVGSTTYYRSPDDSALAIEVINNAGTLEPTGRKMPSQEAISELQKYVSELISNDPSISAFVQWEAVGGFILGQLSKDSLKTAGFEVGAKRLSMDSMETLAIDEPELVLQDQHGFVIQRQTSEYLENSAGKFIPADNNDYVIEDEHGFHIFSAMQSGSPTSTEDKTAARDAYIAKMDNLALAVSSAVNNTLVTGIQRPVFDFNLVITYGQSLSTGTEGWAALSNEAFEAENVLMFGDAVRPTTDRDTGGSVWSPVGGAALKPLRAVTQAIGGGSILTAAEEAVLTPGATNEGETFDVGAVNFWRRLQNDFRGLSVNPERKIIVLNCGVQGRTVEQLSKGNPLNHYNRVIQAVTKVKAYIASQYPTASVGITAFLYAQGEWNYWAASSGTHDRATFLELTKQLRTDLITDCAYGICGQTLPPAWVTYQTGAGYTVDTQDLAIGMAQIDMIDTVPGCFMATPVYQLTDKNGHLDPNGYRWAGMQFGKVLHRILDRGIDWKPMKPIKAVRYSDDEVLLSFLTPSPPAQFKETYVVNTATMYPNKGFLAKDDIGVVDLLSVAIVGQCCLSIKLSRQTSGDVYIWYAPGTTYRGNGNLCDSDTTVSPYNYEYRAGSGQYPSANIAALVDKPYPLNNWCCAFRIKVEEK